MYVVSSSSSSSSSIISCCYSLVSTLSDDFAMVIMDGHVYGVGDLVAFSRRVDFGLVLFPQQSGRTFVSPFLVESCSVVCSMSDC